MNILKLTILKLYLLIQLENATESCTLVMLPWIKDVYSIISVACGLNWRYMQLFNFRRKPYWAKCHISWLLPKIKYTSSFCYNVLESVLCIFSCMLCKGSAFFSHPPCHLYIFTYGINNSNVKMIISAFTYSVKGMPLGFLLVSTCLSEATQSLCLPQSAAVSLVNQALKTNQTKEVPNQPEVTRKKPLIFSQMLWKTL